MPKLIKGTFTRNQAGLISEFTLTGHAEAGPYGSDIVCSAVSALAISTVNSLDALAGVTPNIETNDAEGGYLHVALKEDDSMTQEQMNISQILLEHLLLGLQSIETEYLDFIEVQTESKS